MFGSLGATEILVLAVIGLLVFGPRRLPEMGRTLGRTLFEFRRAAMDLRTSIEREIHLEELKQTGRSIRDEVTAGGVLLAPPAAGPTATAPPAAAPPAPASPSGGDPPTGSGPGDPPDTGHAASKA